MNSKLTANETSGLLRSTVTLIKQFSKASIFIATIFDLLHDVKCSYKVTLLKWLSSAKGLIYLAKIFFSLGKHIHNED